MKFTSFQIVALLAITTAAFPVGTNNEAAIAKPLKQRDIDDGLSPATGHQHRRRQPGGQGKESKMSKVVTIVKTGQESTPSSHGSTAGSAGVEDQSTGASSHTYSHLVAAQKFSLAPKGIKPGQTVPVAGQKSTKNGKGSKSAATLGNTGSQPESAMMKSSDLRSAGSGMAGGTGNLPDAPSTPNIATDATTKGLDGGVGESTPYVAKPSYAQASDDIGSNPNSQPCVCPNPSSSTSVDSVGSSDPTNCSSSSSSSSCACICGTPDSAPPSYNTPDSSGDPASPSYDSTTEEDCDPEDTTDSKAPTTEATDDEAAPSYESSTATDESTDTSTDTQGQDGGVGESKEPEHDATGKSEAAPSYEAQSTKDNASQTAGTGANQAKKDATGKSDAAATDAHTDATQQKDADSKEVPPSYATPDTDDATQPKDADSKDLAPSYAVPETDDTTKQPVNTDSHAQGAVTPSKTPAKSATNPTQPKDADSKQAPPSYTAPETHNTTKNPVKTDSHAQGASTPAKNPADAKKPAPPSYDSTAVASGSGGKKLFKRVEFTA